MLWCAIENQGSPAENGTVALGSRFHDSGNLVLYIHAVRDRVWVLHDRQTLVAMDKLRVSEVSCTHLLVGQTEGIAQLSDLYSLENATIANLREIPATRPPVLASARSQTAACASGRWA